MGTLQEPLAEAAAVMNGIASEAELVAATYALAGAEAQFSESEKALVANAPAINAKAVHSARTLIEAGRDPLGEAFCRLRSAQERRAAGAIYTPASIIQHMLDWATREGTPTQIVDPGCGSGRFILAAARRFPKAELVAVDIDPIATLMLRANANVLGLVDRLTIECGDYRRLALPNIKGPTLFIGNPPYVRHHEIGEEEKAWFAETAAVYGLKASKLAGLHIHFFLRTRELGRLGDYGAFITSAEWLDVNYGAVLRKMLADGLGGTALHLLAPRSMPFDAATTGAITCFRIGRRPDKMVMREVDSVDNLESLTTGRDVPWVDLERAHRWTPIIKPTSNSPRGYIEVGELCRVHRGQVTGSNDVWIAGAYPGELPDAFLFPAVTRARELLAAGRVLDSADHLRRVIDLPADLDAVAGDERRCVEQFLNWAVAKGAQESYIASTRRAWWSVNLRAPAPILCTYMARRPPAFVRNLCGARHLNISHGLYPRVALSDSDLMVLVDYLSKHVRTDLGRTYAGGLTKFEPKELERIPIPPLERLHEIAGQMDNGTAASRRSGSESRLSPRTA